MNDIGEGDIDMNEYTQGTLIYGLRSQYYKNICCYGIIITARCDIAQEKVPVIHALSAMSLYDWVCTELFERASNSYLENDILGPIKQWAKDSGLDFNTLLGFGPQKVLINLNSDASLKVKRREKLESSISAWEEWEGQKDDLSQKRKKVLLNGPLSSKKADLLSDLLTGKLANNFCFIPGDALEPSRDYEQGIVVILRDIIHISLDEIKAICSYKLDYTYLYKTENGAEITKKLNEKFFLTKEGDFSAFDGKISSPWIEYLMQNFSNTFTRIGVNTPLRSNLLTFCKNYKV